MTALVISGLIHITFLRYIMFPHSHLQPDLDEAKHESDLFHFRYKTLLQSIRDREEFT